MPNDTVGTVSRVGILVLSKDNIVQYNMNRIYEIQSICAESAIGGGGRNFLWKNIIRKLGTNFKKKEQNSRK